jgi:hypothetical protein
LFRRRQENSRRQAQLGTMEAEERRIIA